MFVARPPLGHTLATSQSAETSRRQSYLTCVYITKRLESACSQLAQSCSKGILEASSFREMSSKARSRGVDYLRVWECVMVIMKQVARAGIQDYLGSVSAACVHFRFVLLLFLVWHCPKSYIKVWKFLVGGLTFFRRPFSETWTMLDHSQASLSST